MEDSLNDLFDMINIGPRIDVFEMTTIKRDPVTRVANPLSFWLWLAALFRFYLHMYTVRVSYLPVLKLTVVVGEKNPGLKWKLIWNDTVIRIQFPEYVQVWIPFQTYMYNCMWYAVCCNTSNNYCFGDNCFGENIIFKSTNIYIQHY